MERCSPPRAAARRQLPGKRASSTLGVERCTLEKVPSLVFDVARWFGQGDAAGPCLSLSGTLMNVPPPPLLSQSYKEAPPSSQHEHAVTRPEANSLTK